MVNFALSEGLPGDVIPVPIIPPYFSYAMDQFLEHTKDVTDRPLKILDVGCGDSSAVSLYLRKSSRNIIAHGLDIDEYAKNNRLLDQVYIGSAEDMPLADDTYDMVSSKFLLEHVEDAKKTLYSMSRVLQKNGVLVIAIPNPNSPEAIVTKLTPYSFHILFKRVVQKIEDADQNTFPTLFDFRSVGNIKSILHEFGFSSVEAQYFATSHYRFRRRPILGRIAVLYTKLLSWLKLDFLQSTVLIMGIK